MRDDVAALLNGVSMLDGVYKLHFDNLLSVVLPYLVIPIVFIFLKLAN